MLTREGLDWLRDNIPRANGVVIPNPVPYPLERGEPVLIPDSVVRPGRKLLLAVGRMDKQKQFDHAIEAFARLAERHSSWDLVVLGDGPERSDLEQKASALGLKHRVHMPGRAGNIAEWYERADLYVMSSRFEGFPNTLAEAMAHGCAAVSYDCDTGPRDIIRDGVDGLLVRPASDIDALAGSLSRLMADDDTRRLMATRGVDVRQRYSVGNVVARWDEILETTA
jgi:glycosyltransferase involved in cell wall biosynthesis